MTKHTQLFLSAIFIFLVGIFSVKAQNGTLAPSEKPQNPITLDSIKAKVESKATVNSIDSPDPNKFVFATEQPRPLNMMEVRKAIQYPVAAIEAGAQGEVSTRILVDENGNYVKHIVANEVHKSLIEEVEKHIKKLKFVPANLNGKPIAFWVNIPFKFELPKSKKAKKNKTN